MTENQDNVSLKEHLDHRFSDLYRFLEARFEGQKTAVEKAEATMNLRLLGMNEFRDQMKDQAASFVTRDEHTVWIDRVVSLEKRAAAQAAVGALLLVAIPLVVNYLLR